MHYYKIALFGHRNFCWHRNTENKLKGIFRDVMQANRYVEIYVGRNGDFDIFAAAVVKATQKELGKENLAITLVLPYPQKDIQYYEKYYDDIIIPQCVEKLHPKGAITRRNRWMVEECDLLICYVERKSGGAYTALKYANSLNKNIINLAADECDNQ